MIDNAGFVNAGWMRESLIPGAIGTVFGILLTAPESDPPASAPVRLALTATCLIAVVLIPASARKWYTLALWAAIGATLGLSASAGCS